VEEKNYYAEAFFVQPGQCFRMVHSGVGHAMHCPAPVEWHGRFQDGTRKWHEVGSCVWHREDLTDWRPIGPWGSDRLATDRPVRVERADLRLVLGGLKRGSVSRQLLLCGRHGTLLTG
jgi:hypothetical protein